ncbi:MAG TPA: hypothetical protein VGH14_05825 [Solirubrobacterales bacterium]
MPKWCPFALAQQDAHAGARLHSGDVGVDAEGHARVPVAHLCGGDGRVLAKLGAQRRVGPAQRVEGDAVREERPVFGGELGVGPLDSGIEDFGADTVALPRFAADATGEDEVVWVGPLGSQLVFAQEQHQLRLEGDFSKSGRGLGDRHRQDPGLQVQVAPTQVGQL